MNMFFFWVLIGFTPVLYCQINSAGYYTGTAEGADLQQTHDAALRNLIQLIENLLSQ